MTKRILFLLVILQSLALSQGTVDYKRKIYVDSLRSLTPNRTIHVLDTARFYKFSRFDLDVSIGGNLSVTGTGTFSIANDDNAYTGIVVSESGLLKYRTTAQVLSDLTGISTFGSANQLVGVNSGATGWEYKAVTVTAAGAVDGVTTLNASGAGTFGGTIKHVSSTAGFAYLAAINTNTAQSSGFFMAEVDNGTTPTYFQRFGSTHATKPNQTDIVSTGAMNFSTAGGNINLTPGSGTLLLTGALSVTGAGTFGVGGSMFRSDDNAGVIIEEPSLTHNLTINFRRTGLTPADRWAVGTVVNGTADDLRIYNYQTSSSWLVVNNATNLATLSGSLTIAGTITAPRADVGTGASGGNMWLNVWGSSTYGGGINVVNTEPVENGNWLVMVEGSGNPRPSSFGIYNQSGYGYTGFGLEVDKFLNVYVGSSLYVNSQAAISVDATNIYFGDLSSGDGLRELILKSRDTNVATWNSSNDLTLSNNLTVTGIITAGRSLQLSHATNPYLRLSKTDATAQNWDVQISSDNFYITDATAVLHALILAKATGNATLAGTATINGTGNSTVAGNWLVSRAASGAAVSLQIINSAAKAISNHSELWLGLTDNTQDYYILRHRQGTAADNDSYLQIVAPNGTVAFEIFRNANVSVSNGAFTASSTISASNFSGSSSGTNTGDQTITLTGNVTGSGTGSFAATIANDAVTYAKMQNVSATSRIMGRITAGAGDMEELTAANVKTILGLTAADIGAGTFTGAFTFANNLALTAKISTYNNVATEGYGVPAIVDFTTASSQSTSIGATALSNTTATGNYRISVYLECDFAGSGGATVLGTIHWEGTGGANLTEATTNLTMNAVGDKLHKTYFINHQGGGAVSIQYSTTYVAGDTETYLVRVVAERLN